MFKLSATILFCVAALTSATSLRGHLATAVTLPDGCKCAGVGVIKDKDGGFVARRGGKWGRDCGAGRGEIGKDKKHFCYVDKGSCPTTCLNQRGKCVEFPPGIGFDAANCAFFPPAAPVPSPASNPPTPAPTAVTPSPTLNPTSRFDRFRSGAVSVRSGLDRFRSSTRTTAVDDGSLESTAIQMKATAARMKATAATFEDGEWKVIAEKMAASAQQMADSADKLAETVNTDLDATPKDVLVTTFGQVQSSAAGLSSDANDIKASTTTLAERSDSKAKENAEKMQQNADKLADNLSGLSSTLNSVTTDDIDLLLAAWSDMQVAAPPQMTENLALLQENAQLLEAFKPPKMAASRVFNDHLKTSTPAHSRYQVLSSVSLTAGMVPNERLLKGGLRSIDVQNSSKERSQPNAQPRP